MLNRHRASALHPSSEQCFPVLDAKLKRRKRSRKKGFSAQEALLAELSLAAPAA